MIFTRVALMNVLTLHISHQLDRVKYVLCSYLRVRLKKVNGPLLSAGIPVRYLLSPFLVLHSDREVRDARLGNGGFARLSRFPLPPLPRRAGIRQGVCRQPQLPLWLPSPATHAL